MGSTLVGLLNMNAPMIPFTFYLDFWRYLESNWTIETNLHKITFIYLMKKFDWSEVTRSEEVEALRGTKVKIRILPLEHSKPKCESDGYKFLKPHSASSGSLPLSPSSNFFLFLSLLSTILFHQPVFYSLG